MRKWFAVIFMLSSFSLIGQIINPKIKNFEIKNKIIHSKINGKALTLYLEFQSFSNYSLYLYSTKGWYYVDNNKDEKVSLIGFHTPEKVILYSIKDSLKRNKLLNFKMGKDNYFSELRYYTELESYNAKFEISKSNQYWIQANDKKKLNVNLEDFRIQKSISTLALNETSNFNLSSILPPFAASEILAFTENKILLKYIYTPGRNVMGMCGAGEEVVLLLLSFDANLSLLSEENFLVGSCYLDLEFERIKSNERKLRFNVSDWGNDKRYNYTFFLDSLEYLKK